MPPFHTSIGAPPTSSAPLETMGQEEPRSSVRAFVLERVTGIVASEARLPPEAVLPDADLRDELGLKSLEVLVVRESIERAFQVTISDADATFHLSTVSQVVDLLLYLGVPRKQPESAPQTSTEGPPGSALRPDGTLETSVEISMPLLGQNGLAESPLLMRVADLRWQHMGAVAHILTRDVVDAEGDRLYAAVFFVETCFPPARPMGTFVENDRISVISTLTRFGTSMLDGLHYIFPFEASPAEKVVPANAAEALTRGIPSVRISNSFVKKREGAGWLKKSRPAGDGFTRIREVGEPPSSHAEATAVREGGQFFEVPPTYTALTAEPVVVPYEIQPDRDMNGAGLLYFAMYPAIMDGAERRVLSDAGPFTLSDELIDRRTLVHRKIAYFSNAPARDRVLSTIRIWVENPFLSGAPDPEMAPVRLLEEIRMNRVSDGRLMAVSGAKKVVLGSVLGDTTLLESLKQAPGR